ILTLDSVLFSVLRSEVFSFRQHYKSNERRNAIQVREFGDIWKTQAAINADLAELNANPKPPGLGQIRRRDYGQTGTRPCTNCLNRCTSARVHSDDSADP